MAESRNHLFSLDRSKAWACLHSEVPAPRIRATQNKKASSGELACLFDSTGAAGRNRTGDLR
ncbi:MAG: hypothetical protein Q8M64_05065, partial [Methyloversatilis sp.]|nr:hypothetical protein [Methyloversatilis sp.]